MSENESHHHGKNEIIIVKRHGGGHDGHHGGAWKIAYADFMTAMMAFFLVMWLINAANPQTKAALASYFNPVQLTDAKPSEKGVKQPAKDAKGEEDQMKSKVDGTETKTGGSAKNGDDLTATSGEETQYSDADFFENPYSVMSEIVNETGRQGQYQCQGRRRCVDLRPCDRRGRRRSLSRSVRPGFLDEAGRTAECGKGRRQPRSQGGRWTGRRCRRKDVP